MAISVDDEPDVVVLEPFVVVALTRDADGAEAAVEMRATRATKSTAREGARMALFWIGGPTAR
jgi:hypothetical protein